MTTQHLPEAILNQKQLAILLVSILIVALCGIAYELIIGTVSTYLLGNSVYQFSLTIGLFMFAMGIGSFLSKLFEKSLLSGFIIIEVIIALIGGISSIVLFMFFPFATALYSAIMYSLILVIGTLVGLEIPLLTRILSRQESIRKSIAHVLSLDYIGALIGSVSFPLFLLPHLGLIRSSFAIGLINAGTAIVNVFFFRGHLKNPRFLMILSVFSMGILIVLTVLGARLTSFAEQHLYFDQIVYKKQTPYQKIVYTQSIMTGENRLFIDGHIQFSDRDEYRYHEALVHPAMSVAPDHQHILILGGGDGMAAREVLKYPGVEAIDLVDIDPDITRFCSTFPDISKLNKNSLQHRKVTVFNEDAFSFINQPGVLYDRVIIDLPDPHNEALNKLYAREFYKMIRKRMQPDGILVSQSSSPFFTRKAFWCIERTLEEAGFSTFSYKITVPSFGIWGFHLGAVSGDIVLDDFNIQVPTMFMNNEIMRSASVFGKDIQKLDVPVNTIMEPKLYDLYLRELREGPI